MHREIPSYTTIRGNPYDVNFYKSWLSATSSYSHHQLSLSHFHTHPQSLSYRNSQSFQLPPTPFKPTPIPKMHPSTILAFLFAAAVAASPIINRQTVASGNDGSGDQRVGNSGQNSGSAAANKGKISGDYTVEQGVQTCGNAQLNCCNKVEKMGDTTNAGVLGSVFGSGDVGVQCTPVNVPLAIARMYTGSSAVLGCFKLTVTQFRFLSTRLATQRPLVARETTLR